MILIQSDQILFEKILNEVKSNNCEIGAISSFIGYVRDFDYKSNERLVHLKIEHYEGMTQEALKKIEKSAHEKWDLIETRIIHRVGAIKLNDPIVFIIVASKHRDNAFDACRYIIDYLKTEAPFWKKEISNNHSIWVEQKESDLIKVK
jgi:molybdopterin synthase catalytic subunit